MEHQRGPLNGSTWPTHCYPYCTTHTLKSQSKKIKPEAVPLCPSFPAPRPPWGRGPTRPCWRGASLQKTSHQGTDWRGQQRVLPQTNTWGCIWGTRECSACWAYLQEITSGFGTGETLQTASDGRSLSSHAHRPEVSVFPVITHFFPVNYFTQHIPEQRFPQNLRCVPVSHGSPSSTAHSPRCPVPLPALLEGSSPLSVEAAAPFHLRIWEIGAVSVTRLICHSWAGWFSAASLARSSFGRN